MSLTFPASPTVGDTYTVGARTWTWSGTIWEMTGTVAVAGSIGTAELAASAVTQAKLTSGLSGITVTTTSLRSSVIPSPFTGQFAFMTDTNAFIRWDGSAWVTAIVTVPSEAPTSLALVSATTTTATISFSEGATGGSAITNYQYALSTNSGSSYGYYNALATPDGTSPITIPGLALGTAYYIKLKAVNAQGVSNVESSALSFSTSSLSVEYLTVAGGGSGGCPGGGGGAGGYRTSTLSLTAGTYLATVGAGAANRSSGGAGTKGSNSVFSTVTATGGGFGGQNSSGNAGPGGSGGGGSRDGGALPGSGNQGGYTPVEGYAGGTSTVGGYVGGSGGGGASAVGSNGTGGSATTELGGAGGVGTASAITGSSVFYAGGGGGGCEGTMGITAGAGGNGGGGAGAKGATSATAGTVNTGGGGGGTGQSSQNTGAGGSGVVILRYLTADAAGVTFTVGAGLTSTTTTSGSYTVRTFTVGSGNLVIS